jgi:hypothetical protein
MATLVAGQPSYTTWAVSSELLLPLHQSIPFFMVQGHS